MSCKHIIPKYLDTSIVFGNIELPIDYFKQLILVELKSDTEIASILTDLVGCSINRAAIRKLRVHYNIVLSPELIAKKHEKIAKNTATTIKEKYGVSNVFQLDSTKQKANETKLQRYGTATYNNTEQSKQTCLEKYGVQHYSSTDECKQKVKNTNLEKYGSSSPAGNKEVMSKMRQTCLEKYGVDNYWKANSFLAKQQLKYFENNPQLTPLYKEVYKDTDKLRDAIITAQDKTIAALSILFGLSTASTYQLLYKHDLLDLVDTHLATSHYEKEIATFIGQDICNLNDRQALNPYEIDIYIPSKKIGIEFNGTYWHSTFYKDKMYHLNKSKLAAEAGIRLIHIYEYEWLDPIQREKIKMMLNIALGRVTSKIYARQCSVQVISNAEAKHLNEAVHLQGHRDAAVTYGLFYKGILVQLMSFSKTRYNKNLKTENSWEIIRGCPGSNNIVIGGVSKLFKHFIKDYNPTEVFSYCDFNKFDGKSYEAIGMSFVGYTGPDMKWILNDGTVVSRKPSKHKELKQLACAQIFGAGSKKYLWRSNCAV